MTSTTFIGHFPDISLSWRIIGTPGTTVLYTFPKYFLLSLILNDVSKENMKILKTLLITYGLVLGLNTQVHLVSDQINCPGIIQGLTIKFPEWICKNFI